MNKNVFSFQHDGFDGPLDLLLELIENEKLDISKISLAKVTDDYIKYVRSQEITDPEQLAEFLVVAAQLMLIKSKSLLPDLKLEADEEMGIDELQRRLEEYKKIKEMAKEIKKLENKKQFIFTREAYLGIDPVFYPPKKTTVSAIKNIFAAFLASVPKIEKLAEEKIKRIVSIEEKISHIRSFLQEAVEGAFSQIVRGAKEKVDVIVSFLALLELSKQKFVELEQRKSFGDIVFKKK